MRMIQLTRFNTYKYSAAYGAPVWVNPDHIISISQTTTGIIEKEEDAKELPADREKVNYSLVILSAAGPDGIETEHVIESPMAILDLISKAEIL